MGILILGIRGPLGEEEELGTIVLLQLEEGGALTAFGGVARAAGKGGVADDEVGGVDVVEILLLLLLGLPPLDFGKGVVGS